MTSRTLFPNSKEVLNKNIPENLKSWTNKQNENENLNRSMYGLSIFAQLISVASARQCPELSLDPMSLMNKVASTTASCSSAISHYNLTSENMFLFQLTLSTLFVMSVHLHLSVLKSTFSAIIPHVPLMPIYMAGLAKRILQENTALRHLNLLYPLYKIFIAGLM